MAFPKPQNPFDWLTQCWNIALGARIRPEPDEWIIGPVGIAGENPEAFLLRYATERGLSLRRQVPGAGLLVGFGLWNLELDPRVEAFYTRTSDHTLQVQAAWGRRLGFLGLLTARLFTRRIRQFHLPEAEGDADVAFHSELVQFVDQTGQVVNTVWLRSVKDTRQMVFYGEYSTCKLPSGEFAIKSVFPLPEGNATVLFRVTSGENGSLELVSAGRKFGDAGFYFLVRDRIGTLWRHYIPSFTQRIHVFVDGDSVLRAEHSMSLWSFDIYRVHYTIVSAST